MAVARNDSLIQALKVMPTVLYERNREFGQVSTHAYPYMPTSLHATAPDAETRQ